MSRHQVKDPAVEVYKRDVDVSLIRENLKRTPEERVRNLIRLQRDAEELARAGRRQAGEGTGLQVFRLACRPIRAARLIRSTGLVRSQQRWGRRPIQFPHDCLASPLPVVR